MAKTKGPATTAWNAFSQWVRVKGCIETTGYPFVGVCITCERKFHITALDAGHMIPGRSNAVLFHEELVNLQCGSWCNRVKHGELKKYREIMVKKYGEEQILRWEQEAKKPIHDRDMDYEAIKLKYRAKITKLLIPFGYNTYKELLAGHQL